jgi:hypothetical protein
VGARGGDLASTAAARVKSVSSLLHGAMIWKPTGSPSDAGSVGTLSAGIPARLAGKV